MTHSFVAPFKAERLKEGVKTEGAKARPEAEAERINLFGRREVSFERECA